MNIRIADITRRISRTGPLGRISYRIKAERDRRTRRALVQRLDDHLLKDIGLTRDDVWERDRRRWNVPAHWRA